MAAVGDGDAQLVVARGNVGEIGVVAVVDAHPVLVEALQFVGVADLLEFAEIKGGEGDVEGIVVVADHYVRFGR